MSATTFHGQANSRFYGAGARAINFAPIIRPHVTGTENLNGGSISQNNSTGAFTFTLPAFGAATPNPADMVSIIWPAVDFNGSAVVLATTQLLQGRSFRSIVTSAPSATSNTFVAFGWLNGSDLATANGVIGRIRYTGSAVSCDLATVLAGTATYSTAPANVSLERAYLDFDEPDDAASFTARCNGFGTDFVTRLVAAGRSASISLLGPLHAFVACGATAAMGAGASITHSTAYAPPYVLDLDDEQFLST